MNFRASRTDGIFDKKCKNARLLVRARRKFGQIKLSMAEAEKSVIGIVSRCVEFKGEGFAFDDMGLCVTRKGEFQGDDSGFAFEMKFFVVRFGSNV